eukprot:14913465-Heterocapsa_arctica.AAC.1
MPVTTPVVLQRSRDSSHRVLVVGPDAIEEPHAAASADIARRGGSGRRERRTTRVHHGLRVDPPALGRCAVLADVQD